MNNSMISVATWNLNHRVGKTKYRELAAPAAAAIGADVLVLTEYFPQANHDAFCKALRQNGYPYMLATQQVAEEPANGVLIASRTPMEPFAVTAPAFDAQMPSNQLAVRLPELRLSVLGVRIPVYKAPVTANLGLCWEWLERVADTLKAHTAVIAGDLNVRPGSVLGAGGRAFTRLQANGWRRVRPSAGYSFFGANGACSELDHVLVTDGIAGEHAEYLLCRDDHVFARATGALSDHAPLLARVRLSVMGR